VARAHRSGGGVGVRVHLCGELAVEWDGERLTEGLPGRQGRLLFAFLVLNRRRAVRRDELEEAAETTQLAPPLSRLRKALGPGRLEGRGELRLALPDDAWIDWEVAHHGLERARAAMRMRAWADAWGPASAARSIAERGLLPGLDAPWIEPLRAELADLRVDALEALARTGVELGGEELAPAERAARAAVEAAPFRESSRAVLMDALRARGNAAEALLVYEDARTLLRDELGASPGPELVARHEALLRGEGPPVAAPSAPDGAPSASPERAPSGLVERDRELAALTAALDRATAGGGGVVVIEGPAGVGKTRLLSELRATAEARGARVLAARSGELERDFAFGVVRQLFEAEVARAPLTGAAAPAAAVFGGGSEDGDISFAALHGLFWLATELAADTPTVLAVDDLQWSDPASLRWFAYLARRLEGVPLLIAATLRTGEPAADAVLVDELLRDPAATSLRPGPLSVDAVHALVARTLGAEPDAAFARACHEATAGNPLLLGRLLTALREDGVRPEAAAVGVVAEVGARAVSRSVRSRLARLPAGAGDVARAIAILGEGARLPAVAAFAGLGEAAATDAVAALVRADILRADAQLGFVHPLVRAAVYEELSPVERERRHYEAASTLTELRAPVDEVALHLLKVPPRGDAWVADTLREAGRVALGRGGVDSALAHLRRALAEPPPADERPRLLLELGRIEREVDAPVAAVHLREAYASLTDARERAAAAESLLWALCFVGPPEEAIPVMEQTLADLPPELVEERLATEALGLFIGYWYGYEHRPDRWAELRRDPPAGGGHGARMMQGMIAWQWAVSDGPADRCAQLARTALGRGTLLAHDPGLSGVAAACVLAMADADDALEPWDDLRRDAERRGSAMVTTPLALWRGWALSRRGELEEAEAALREGLISQVVWGLGPEVRAYTLGLASEPLLERGHHDDLRAMIADAVEPPPGSDLHTFLHTARAQLALAEGAPAEAVAQTDGLGGSPIENPAWSPWRSVRALALEAVGRHDDAIALAREDLDYAGRWGAPGALGRALRVLGTLEGAAGTARLEAAVAALEGSHSRLELARALAALGEHAGDDALLRRALAIAETCGARVLAARLRALGVDVEPALTALQRRVALLAADGMDAPAIAQSLFLTPKAAADHLEAALRTLGAGGREELREALAAGS
jgi:DNA-binding SARP family transcriptional activator/tetratricopeptide (TPR) repeat protein